MPKKPKVAPPPKRPPAVKKLAKPRGVAKEPQTSMLEFTKPAAGAPVSFSSELRSLVSPDWERIRNMARCDNIEFKNVGFCVTIRGEKKTYYKGITKLLPLAYGLLVPSAGDTSCAHERCKGATPMDHGSAVDAEVAQFVTGGCDWDQFVASFRGNVRHPYHDPCSERLISFFAEQGWFPVAAQFPIYSEHYQFATAVDFVCVANGKKHPEVIFVELKTSKGNSYQAYTSSGGGMRILDKPFDRIDLPRSKRNMDMLQLLATYMVISRCFGIKRKEFYKNFYLIHVESTGVRAHQLPRELVADDIVSDFGARIKDVAARR